MLTIAQIIKAVMDSSAEEAMVALYITAKNMIPLCNTLIEMGSPQPKSPIQTDKSTDVGSLTKSLSTKIPNQRIQNYGGSETGNHWTSSGTIRNQDLKMKDTTAQSINP